MIWKCKHYLEETCTDKSNILSCYELIELHARNVDATKMPLDSILRMFGAQTAPNIILQILMVLLLIQAVYLTESMII